MDQVKTGELIRHLRIRMNLTQKQLADMINISDKAISKWECGNGYPDVSMLSALADVFGIDVRVFLMGEIEKNDREKLNMRKMRFYVCSNCGNIITSLSETSVTCCGNKMFALDPQKAEKNDMLNVEDIGGEWFITSDHTMTKEHYISFVAYVNDRSAMIFKQYPEWNLEVTLPRYRAGRLFWYCTKHGLFYQDIGK